MTARASHVTAYIRVSADHRANARSKDIHEEADESHIWIDERNVLVAAAAVLVGLDLFVAVGIDERNLAQ